LASNEKVAKVGIIAIISLIVMKGIVSAITGSVGIRADAIHSIIDLTGAIIGFVSIRIASRPPDTKHAFGHGKAEDIAGVVIGALILSAAGVIAYQAINRLMVGGYIELVTMGIYVTAAAIAINILIARYTLRMARLNDSVALEATARDMMADVFSSVAVLAGLVLVKITGITILDPVVALVVVVLIVRSGYPLMKKSLDRLMDTRLPEAEEEVIGSCLMALKSRGRIVDFHKLRTRKAGSQRHIDLHLVVPKNTSIHESHELCDELEQAIEKRLNNADVTIHIEPCNDDCSNCYAYCNLKKDDH
jgi:cation diffusion facilitator family transporter